MCITNSNNVYYDFLERNHKDTQRDSKEINLPFSIYDVLKLRLQNSMIAIHLSTLEAIFFSSKLQMKCAMKFWKPTSIIYAL